MNLLLKLKKYNPELINQIEEKSLFKIIFDEYIKYKTSNIYVQYAKLLKNLGKLYREKHYDGISIYMSLNFLKNENLKDHEIIRIYKIISEESFVLKWYKNGNLNDNLYRYEEELINDLLEFHSIKNTYNYKKEIKRTKKKYSVNILSGPPGVGKSTYSKKLLSNKSLYVSRDKCTMEIGKLYGLNTYDESFNLTDKKNINLILNIFFIS